MATNLSVTSGGSYTTLAAAVAALETGGGAEHDFSTDGIATITIETTNTDTTDIDIVSSSFTNPGSTSATAYLKITTDSASRHDGKRNTAKHYFNANPTGQPAILRFDLDWTWIENCQFILPSSATTSEECIRINSGCDNFLIEKCVIYSDSTSGSTDGIYSGNWACSGGVFDCVIRMESGNRAGIHAQNYNGNNAQTWWIEHNTIDANGASYGFGAQSNDLSTNTEINAWNNYAADAGTTDYENDTGGLTAANLVNGSRSNISSDTTAQTEFGSTGNTNSIALNAAGSGGYDVTSLTNDAEDYQIVSGAAASVIDGAASGATQDSRVDITLDIAGNTRDTTYTDRDVGAFEVAAAPPVGARPQGPFNHVFNGPFGGPIA